jgi:uncharacterized phage infection (PIP) family protein YhgE
MSFAALTVDFNARLASLESDMKRVARSVDSFDQRLGRAGDAFGRTLKGLGLALVVQQVTQAFTGLIKEQVNFADSLNDMSQRTGVGVKTLAGFKLAAEQTGTSLDQVAGGINKLSVNLIAARDGNKELAGVFSQLGVSGTDAQEALFKIADRFAAMPDGAEKAAVATKLFGKAIGPELIPFLNQGGEGLRKMARESESFADTMARLAPNADKFNDDMAKLKQTVSELAANVATALVPALNDLFNKLNDIIGAMGRASAAGGGFFRSLFSGATAALGDPQKEITRINALIKSLEKAKADAGKPGVTVTTFPFGDLDKQIAAAKADLETMRALQRQQALALNEADTGDAGNRIRPQPKKATAINTNAGRGGGGAGRRSAVDDPTRDILDAKLRDIEKSLARERDVLGFQEQFLRQTLDEGLISYQQYYAEKRAANSAFLQTALAGYEKEIGILEATRGQFSKDRDKRKEIDARINEVLEKRAQLLQDNAQKSVQTGASQSRDAEEYKRRVEEINAALAEMAGKLEEAAQIRLRPKIDDLRRTLKAAGTGEFEIEASVVDFTDAEMGQAKFNVLRQESQRISESLSDAEAKLRIEARGRGEAEETTERKLIALRERAAAQYEVLAQKVQAVAEQFNSPELQSFAASLEVQIQDLITNVDPELQRLREMGKELGQAIAGSFEDAILSGESLGDTLKALGKDIERIILRKLVTEPLGNFLGDAIAGAFGGARAAGGPIKPGKWYIAGERGPEPIWGGGQGAFVVPNDRVARARPAPATAQYTQSGPISIVVNVPRDTARGTAEQTAAMVGASVQRAVRRNR